MENEINELKSRVEKLEQKLEHTLKLFHNGADKLPSASGITKTQDGTASAIFRVMSDPKPWPSGKGAFLSCKLTAGDKDAWYDVSLTRNVAEKTQPGWFPSKGDLISVTGKLEQKTGNNGRVYNSIFAFRATIVKASSAPVAVQTKAPFNADVDAGEDVPF